MDVSRIPLISILSRRAQWLGKRQELLSQNIANADTPGFRAQDLQDTQFQQLLKGRDGRLAMTATKVGHVGPAGSGLLRPVTGRGMAGADADFRAQVDRTAAKSPDPTGNTVKLEDELIKVSETAGQYQLVTRLYKKQLDMIRTAIGRRGG